MKLIIIVQCFLNVSTKPILKVYIFMKHDTKFKCENNFHLYFSQIKLFFQMLVFFFVLL